MNESVTIPEHAVAKEHLAVIRDQTTTPEEFRRRTRALSTLLIAEATQRMPSKTVNVTTPLETTACERIAGRMVGVPILRAGLVFVDPLLDLIPQAEIRHLGMYRNEETATPVHYYNKLPEHDPPDVALVLDPMLATGGSASAAIVALQAWGVTDVRMVCVIAAPEGISSLQQAAPNVPVFCVACDRELNDRSFILPGLGDAGDRIFAT